MSQMESRSPAVLFDAVGKRYGDGPAVLHAVSLTIHHGEVVSLLGPSGCGKSTVLKLIAGLSSISSGTVKVDGMTPEKARETVSFLFQDPTLLPWRTVRRNVTLGMDLDGTTKERREARCSEMLQLVGLSDVGDRYPRQLSGGMKMRVSLARALSTHPRLLLLDEPFAALDEMSRDRMGEELLRLQRAGGWTVVFVTHAVHEAVFLSDRVIVLSANPGRIAAELPVDLPRERTADLRSAPEYESQVVEASRLLRAAERR